MEASHKTHRPHIKVGKDEEKQKMLSMLLKEVIMLQNIQECVIRSTCVNDVYVLPDWLTLA